MLILVSAAAIALVHQGSFDLQIKAIAQKRAAFQSLKPTKLLYGGDAGTSFFFPAGRADCRYLYGMTNGMSGMVLIKETLVRKRLVQSWCLKLKEQVMKAKPKPGELNLYLWNQGLTPVRPVSKEIASDLGSLLPLAAYCSSGPIDVLRSYFIVGGKLSTGEPTDMAGAANEAKLRSSYPISTLEIAWLKSRKKSAL